MHFKVAFIPYITAGDPDLSTTAEALKVLDACGSDIIELGVPYSDPLADGPVIQVSRQPFHMGEPCALVHLMFKVFLCRLLLHVLCHEAPIMMRSSPCWAM